MSWQWETIAAAALLSAAAALAAYIAWLRRKVAVQTGKLTNAREEAANCEEEARVDDETDDQLDADLRGALRGPKGPGPGKPGGPSAA